MTINGVSLVICCHNSVDRIVATLEHVRRQQFIAPIPWELIVVDNASTDSTYDLVKTISKTFQFDHKIVTEKKPGLIYARQKGIAESRYEIISFIDDDNWICSNWVETVYDIMNTKHDVGACGGIGTAAFESSPPFWVDSYQCNYAVGPQGTETGYVSDKRGYLWGAGLSLKRTALNSISANGFTSFLTGRKGRSLTSGEDSELCFALRLFGWKLWYDSRLQYTHFLTSNRLEWSYIKRLYRGFGASSVVLDIYKGILGAPLNITHPIKGSWFYQISELLLRMLVIDRFFFNTMGREGSFKTLMCHYHIGRMFQLLHLRKEYSRIRNCIFTLYNLEKQAPAQRE